ADAVAACDQFSEEIVAGRVRCIQSHLGSSGIVEGDYDAGHAGLASVLETVLIEVIPDQVAGAGGLEDARIHGADVVSTGEGEGAGAAGDTVSIAVGGVIAAVGGAEDIARGQLEADLVGAGQQ